MMLVPQLSNVMPSTMSGVNERSASGTDRESRMRHDQGSVACDCGNVTPKPMMHAPIRIPTAIVSWLITSALS